MSFHRFFFLLILLATLVPIAEAGKENGELNLYKDPILEFESARQIGLCPGLRNWGDERDSPDLRNDMRNWHCQGRYSLAIEGSKGKMVTLFAGFNYGKERGYLIVRKLDDKKVWVPDLMIFPANQWVSLPPEDGHIEEYGSFEIFFSPSPNFDQKVSSLKWGRWWKGEIPN